jgi:hypothetical protein
MKRRFVLLVASAGALVAAAAFHRQQPPKLLLLEWASKANLGTPPVAVLIEMGLKDDKPTPWAGRATVTGAKVVHREGYRFRTDDRLTGDDGWEASSHRGLRVPARNPAVAKMEGIATVGVVLHLADLQPDAKLTVHRSNDSTSVAVKDVLTGRRQPLWDGKAVVRLISTATPVVTAKTEDDFPAAAYGPDGTLWVAYISYHVKDDSRRIESAPLKEQPANFRAYDTPEFGDQLFVKYLHEGKWSEPIPITGPNEDLLRCAVAVEGDSRVWVIYCSHRNGDHHTYVRSLTEKRVPGEAPRVQLGERIQLDNGPPGLPRLCPVACTTRLGDIIVVWQEWKHHACAGLGYATIRKGDPQYDGVDAWYSMWHPALAARPSGNKAVVLREVYRDGDYDVYLTTGEVSPRADKSEVAESSKFEARPTVTCDAQDRIWIAYEEGPVKWGKDYGAQDSGDGNPLYNERSVRVVCLDGGKLMRPVAELPTSTFKPPSLPFEAVKTQGFERETRYAYPKIGIDGKGRVWLTYRQKFGSRYSSHPGSYWLTFARRLDGDRWSEPVEVHQSDGLLDHRPVLLPHPAGGLIVVHNTDGRYTTPETIDNQIYMSYVDLPGEPVEPKLVPHDAGKKDDKLLADAKREAAAVRRIRDYRVEAGGKKYHLLRGEFHRHTEVSWDGGPDGSLEDMFRYAIDAAAMDWIGNGDHDNGAGREYSWWLTQKFTDAYHVPGRFTPMFTYERSVAYPHGHRNCVFARRGIRTLPRLAEPDPDRRVGGFHADDTKMLYRYLHELGGICAVHTSATSMGTDWRDNDPKVEPLVEIYQGDRMSYEVEGAPRAGHDPKSGKLPANVAGWFPKGFINHALQKGYRLGFQASSDHWSTHISYCVVLAERNDRESILDAMRRRHVYGATDDIIVDVRSGPHVMGDEFQSAGPPAFQITVVGTGPIARIDVLKDSEVVETIRPGKAEYHGAWTDPKPSRGVHYYYIRVEQADGELAWASPLWVEYQGN